jgi:hypothetical protein
MDALIIVVAFILVVGLVTTLIVKSRKRIDPDHGEIQPGGVPSGPNEQQP